MDFTFREWLQFTEARYKGLKRLMQNRWTGMPNYVKNDLYGNMSYALNQAVGKGGDPRTGTIHADPTTVSSPIKKIVDKIKENPKAAPEILFKSAGMDSIQWSPTPEVLNHHGRQGVTPGSFDEDTQWRFINRRFGYREEFQIRKDAERTNTQQQIMQTRGEGNNEPIIVIQTMNGYGLLEGWHRTMNFLLSGAPEDQIEALQRGDSEAIDFNKWKPVRIQAFVGRGPDVQRALAGTGEYIPPGLRGTGSWH